MSTSQSSQFSVVILEDWRVWHLNLRLLDWSKFFFICVCRAGLGFGVMGGLGSPDFGGSWTVPSVGS